MKIKMKMIISRKFHFCRNVPLNFKLHFMETCHGEVHIKQISKNLLQDKKRQLE